MKKKKIISQICIHVILVALTAICLLPFLSMISTSFMKVKGVLPNEPILFPNFPLYLENYVKAWTANHFQTYFFNTLYVSVVGLIVNLLISITMAYSFSRFQFPGKEPIFNLLLLTMMIPAQLAMISQYTVLNGLKLIDTYKGIWLLWGVPALRRLLRCNPLAEAHALSSFRNLYMPTVFLPRSSFVRSGGFIL